MPSSRRRPACRPTLWVSPMAGVASTSAEGMRLMRSSSRFLELIGSHFCEGGSHNVLVLVLKRTHQIERYVGNLRTWDSCASYWCTNSSLSIGSLLTLPESSQVWPRAPTNPQTGKRPRTPTDAGRSHARFSLCSPNCHRGVAERHVKWHHMKCGWLQGFTKLGSIEKWFQPTGAHTYNMVP